jgi:DNA-binding transcriptional LysR family regulator
MECNSFEAVIEAEKADIGVTLLPNFCVSGGLKDGSLQSHDLPLVMNGPKFMSILGCKERSSDQLFRSFTDCIDNYFNKGHVL